MGLLLFDRNVQELCPSLTSSPAQASPAVVFWEGGKGKGRGDQAGGSEESASRKNPGKLLGHRVMALSMFSNPSTRDTYLLLFFCLFLWMPCLYYHYYYHYYYSYSVTTLVKEWIGSQRNCRGEVGFGRQKGRLAGG